jgi:hypothetical protein
LNAIVGNLNGQKLSPTKAARLIAGRLEKIGHEPFYSDRERYLVRLDDNSGEIVELGRPLRGSRLFKKSVLARDIATVRDVEAFAATCKEEEWLHWNIGLTGEKAAIGSLVEAYREFGRLINNHFSEMRRRNEFELILLTVHPRYDPFSGRFDLHAHFICRIPREHREAARQRLLTAFSKADVPDEPVRNVAACVTYMVWGIADPEETVELPDAALSDLWALSQSKARLVRKGERLGKWKQKTAEPIDEHERARRERIRKNRAETADPRPQPKWRDRLLAKTKVTIDGKKIAALLFEERRVTSEDTAATTSACPVDSSSATVVTTQDSANDTIADVAKSDDTAKTNTPAKAQERGIGRGVWDRTSKLVKATTVAVARALRVSTKLLRAIAPRGIVRCRGPPR